MVLALLMACGGGDPEVAAENVASEVRSEVVSWSGDLSDVEGRCMGDSDLPIGMLRKRFGVDPSDDVLGFYVEAMLSERWSSAVGNRVVFGSLFLLETQYFENRIAVQEAFESRIRSMDEADRAKAWVQYGLILLQVGEFEKVVSLFAEQGDQPVSMDPGLSYAMAAALWRLERHQEAHAHALRAAEQLPGGMVEVPQSNYDALRLLALVEMSLFGPEFYEKASELLHTERAKELFASDASDVPFEPVGQKLGVDGHFGPGVHAFIDFDGDGWEDLLLEGLFNRPQLFRNDTKGGFEPVSSLDQAGCGYVSVVADFTGDGEFDIYRHGFAYHAPVPPTLLAGDGALAFSDATEGSGIREAAGGPWVGMSPAAADFDLDGDLDLGIAHQMGPSRLLRNDGNGRFEDVSELLHNEPNIQGRPPMQFGFCWGDIDNDGWPDAARSGHGWIRLARNNGDGTFEEITQKAGLTNEDRWYRQCFFTDIDNDNDVDLWVSSVTAMNKHGYKNFPLWTERGWSDAAEEAVTTVFLNNGDGTFTDMGSSAGFHALDIMGGSRADWNNDGWMDILGGPGGPMIGMTLPILFYENNQKGAFELKSPLLEPSLWSKLHGSGWGDYNRDGALDLVTNNGGITPGDEFRTQLWRNTGNDNNWLILRLDATSEGTNTHAVGARVTVTAGDLTQTRELWVGDGLLSSNYRLHFGLGQNTAIDKVVIRWPNREHAETVLTDVPINKALVVNEQGIQKELY